MAKMLDSNLEVNEFELFYIHFQTNLHSLSD